MSNRSGTTFSAPTDANRNRTLLGTLASDGETPVALEANAAGSLLPALVGGPLVGQSKIVSTGVAVRLNGGTSQPLTNGLIITALSTNTATIEVGGSGVTNTIDGTGNGYILAAGASVSFAVTNANDIYINGTSGDIVSWAGS